MTVRDSRANGLWIRLNANYLLDPAVQEVGFRAELAFLRSLALCRLKGSHGAVIRHDYAVLMRGMRRWDDIAGALVEQKLWLPGEEGDTMTVRSWGKYNASTVDGDVVKEQARDRQRRHRDVPPVEPTEAMSRVTQASRAPAREQTNKTGSNRTPSGSVRLEPPTAAPRGTEGAAQPPGNGEVVVGLASSEAKRLAREEIEKGRKRNPAAGRQFAYRPELPSNEPSDFAKTMAKLQAVAEAENPAE